MNIDKIKNYPKYKNINSRSGPGAEKLIYPKIIKHNASIVLEIGTHKGHSTAYLAAACKETNGKVYTIDIDKNAQNQAKEFIEWLKLDNVEFILGDSLEKLPVLLSSITPVISFIDGKHSYEYASQEFNLIWNKCNKLSNYAIILDDIGYVHIDGKKDGGIPKLIKEIKDRNISYTIEMERYAVIEKEQI